MADKSVGELIAAQSVTPTDLFVLEQNGTAKKLTGQILENWLVSFADGHGGIQSIAKLSTSGLVDAYRITLADTTTFDFTVTNGKSITSIAKTGTSGLVDTYKISYNDGSSQTFTVTNGAKGDKGDNAYVWIKYASQRPTESSPSMGDIPDDWIGIYSGNASTAPTDWQQYTWYQIKGEKGDTGSAATVTGTTVEYMISDSGTIVPSGSWSTTIPTVPQGKYLWKRVTTTFNTGSPAVSYSVTRMGIDGTGAVSTVNDKSPDESGNVALTSADIATSGGVSVEAKLNTLDEEKQPLLTPGDNISITGGIITTKAFPCNPNLLDNWYFGNPVDQRNGYIIYEGANLYTDATCTTVTGQTTGGPYQAYPISSICVSFTTNATYYCKIGDAGVVRGYAGFGGYAFDRWKINSDSIVSISVGGLSVIKNIYQPLSSADFIFGQKYTMSALLTDGRLGQLTFTLSRDVNINQDFDFGTFIIYRNDLGPFWLGLYCPNEAICLAIKLELGSQQTLAHKENGVWVLNEIPKFGEQLAACQRYYQVYTTEAARPAKALDCRPVMRTDPVQSTVNVGGTTLYANSAEL